MKQGAAEDGFPLGQIATEEEERRQAMVGVVTNVGIFAAIVLVLRAGKPISTPSI